jgi:phosphoribosyl-ATP pyrophosphohydrolase/phosphoribosyl-AMP cyclohydrolase
MRDRNAPLSEADIAALDWSKMDGLVPAIVQDSRTAQVLMLGYMNEEALRATLRSGFATFYSRSRQRLWEKGESSGNRLSVQAVFLDCDQDALLVQVEPKGSTCHLGTASCFHAKGATGIGFLGRLQQIVNERAGADPAESYTARLIKEGTARVAQKIGEEGVEVALAAVTGDAEACIEESADLLYHLTVLMEARQFDWDDVAERLRQRHEG